MEIQSKYGNLLSRMLSQQGSSTEAPPEKTEKLSGERKEISQLISVVSREMGKLEQESRSQRAAYLESLQEQINQGNYRVPAEDLAQAMLESRE